MTERAGERVIEPVEIAPAPGTPALEPVEIIPAPGSAVLEPAHGVLLTAFVAGV